MSIAIVHEWITARAGSELCFERIAQLHPSADLYALARHPSVHLDVGGRPITTTTLNRVARTHPGRAATLPFMAKAFASLRRPAYDIVISSSHAFSRAFARPGEIHLSYTYTPARYLWYPELDTRGQIRLGRALAHKLRARDAELASRVNAFSAISTSVAERIAECYDRESDVIHPVCDTNYFSPRPQHQPTSHQPYLLSIGRLVPYKRHDLAIQIGERTGTPVVVAGTGPELSRLQSMARFATVPVTIESSPNRERVRELYRQASATIFAPIEDFGIVPVESMACGTPVVAVDAGGSRDTVGNVGGALSPSQGIADLCAAAEQVLDRPPTTEILVKQADQFSPAMFDRRFTEWVDRSLNLANS